MKLQGEIKNLTELEKLSQLLTPFLQPNLYLILKGELGVGKTTLTQLIAHNLGVKEKVSSPTFNILQRYRIKAGYYINHFDFFRLTPADNLNFFQELTEDNLNIIEWPQNNPSFWQNEQYIYLHLLKKKDQIRTIEINFSKLTRKDLDLNHLKKFLTASLPKPN
ncbi:MAG: tRNA (adenosine(37)-N6)-threonylcarbamoyltransferase complex ATPase subunit type 1 TsaE [Candidatus Moeniiplasma glomeromycotorum]|nr:tRNA (adenosine(37)-N6)-threonylcarbamoyltransferase complex ATPase subunit type 1 TsaE [Candidatus Moeniiplasma glomeromycotorum]MCE8168312.1 tRNA (adenosine(37)-N6)-threonylcarbamoyltransferase complex ATPase subunit type 1 TsaE [Candidatus Moeniiplasma glomeromycotorum]MCE8169491.1 tRNA (adenosine(37)-N6)-threonylcarbamoyltransferase complex ATPase subunit type 1 TsaE [Candidatus Moeniiplasma glomeromycotorum]